MLQAIGLTSTPRRNAPPAVDDLTFEAPPGRVTALLGAPGAGKTAALRLMLELDSGRGVAYFRGRPLHRIAHPAREVGVLLGDVPGHPSRTVRGQLRMLCAAAGTPVTRADEMLEVVGLAGLGDQRLGTLSVGMDRRLGLASALLGDPHTLVLDDPAEGLSPRENSWLHGLLRAHAAQGGTVLYATADPKEAARTADHVVTLDAGRLVADQDVTDFARTRLRPRVAVRTPHAARLAAVVSREARAAQRSVEVVPEANGRVTVYGSTCAEIGDTAFRHGVPVHQLADEIGDTGPAAPPPDGTEAHRPAADLSELPPPIRARPARGPLRPLRYELRRSLGVRTTTLIMAAVLLVSAALSVLLARTGGTPLPRALAAWPEVLPLPPAALGAGILGALSFGDEFRYPALAAGRGTVPRRIGLLLAKLTVTAGFALLLAALTVVCGAQCLRLFYGPELITVPANAVALGASWAGLTVGCAWAGLLAAGVFRVTGAGIAAVLAVPVLVVPLVQKVFAAPSTRSVTGLPGRLRELAWWQLPQEADRWVLAVARMVAQPVGAALALSLSALVCAYLFTSLRGKVRW
ncbi:MULTISPECIES: ATP-binding cassette domain-containing protein [Streptomyces]|uniref:ATP-binding cassette domain-containing protein n=1 Tax=Streptomyces TaxID=1883 RepID=UPI00103C1A24|nr:MULTISPECIES: ATP-binding cassette domain-containing protein [Streptomyces]MBT3072423.1 ATP-binding cassette domain-containing protein [Streptomyces sp. COG21]MBT3080824.1 ATP-binding cassette domain-containing protein [Streptomyces sp. COG20]MBT3086818.1 ATP-binding cassette domain-containing protein [Streptomyces sp. CYG21]MBT3099830.1 ATP-binding cassette domain-containing protein [Streptomyces sp. CBG30]MBT3102410.1 ATP-binding cassette domain-containing protein [Streptomyces sp. COG19]